MNSITFEIEWVLRYDAISKLLITDYAMDFLLDIYDSVGFYNLWF
jgi:hypothetical protein